MNGKIIKELKKCVVARIDYSSIQDNLSIVIPKGDKNNQSCTIEIGKRYFIKLQNYIINEPPNFSLSANWNNGSKPLSFYNCMVVNKISGKMMNVNLYPSTEDRQVLDGVWVGWIPRGGIESIEKLDGE